MKFGACSDIGNVRKENEDSFYIPNIEDEIKLFLVADGIGGQSGKHTQRDRMKTDAILDKQLLRNGTEGFFLCCCV